MTRDELERLREQATPIGRQSPVAFISVQRNAILWLLDQFSRQAEEGDDLPAIPAPTRIGWSHASYGNSLIAAWGFTAEQMRAYARQAIAKAESQR